MCYKNVIKVAVYNECWHCKVLQFVAVLSCGTVQFCRQIPPVPQNLPSPLKNLNIIVRINNCISCISFASICYACVYNDGNILEQIKPSLVIYSTSCCYLEELWTHGMYVCVCTFICSKLTVLKCHLHVQDEQRLSPECACRYVKVSVVIDLLHRSFIIYVSLLIFRYNHMNDQFERIKDSNIEQESHFLIVSDVLHLFILTLQQCRVIILSDNYQLPLLLAHLLY